MFSQTHRYYLSQADQPAQHDMLLAAILICRPAKALDEHTLWFVSDSQFGFYLATEDIGPKASEKLLALIRCIICPSF